MYVMVSKGCQNYGNSEVVTFNLDTGYKINNTISN